MHYPSRSEKTCSCRRPSRLPHYGTCAPNLHGHHFSCRCLHSWSYRQIFRKYQAPLVSFSLAYQVVGGPRCQSTKERGPASDLVVLSCSRCRCYCNLSLLSLVFPWCISVLIYFNPYMIHFYSKRLNFPFHAKNRVPSVSNVLHILKLKITRI